MYARFHDTTLMRFRPSSIERYSAGVTPPTDSVRVRSGIERIGCSYSRGAGSSLRHILLRTAPTDRPATSPMPCLAIRNDSYTVG